MKKFRRKADILMNLVTGLVFLYALYVSVAQEGGIYDFSVMKTMECICMLYAGVFYVLSFLYVRKREKGVFIPVLRCSVFLTVTAWYLYGCFFLKGHYGLYPASLQNGITIARYGIGCMLVEWAFSEKGHFWKQFTWSGMIVILVYIVTALIMGYTGHGIGLNSHMYPYPFLDVDVLGWSIVIPTVVILFFEMWVYDRLWIALDQYLKRRKKQPGNTGGGKL